MGDLSLTPFNSAPLVRRSPASAGLWRKIFGRSVPDSVGFLKIRPRLLCFLFKGRSKRKEFRRRLPHLIDPVFPDGWLRHFIATLPLPPQVVQGSPLSVTIPVPLHLAHASVAPFPP